DRDASYVRQADQALCIGPAAPGQSYLNQSAILSAAVVSGAQAIHPGYGFLSENGEFVARVEQAGLTFIGPSAACIRTMGDKVAAKRAMRAAGVPCVPGPDSGLPDDPVGIQALAREIGYPVIVKASAGGGGRGMRVVNAAQDLPAALTAARTEAQAAFGVPDVYLEKFLRNPRHIEFQVLGDAFGNIVHLGERECSIQRRHQKILEESPSTALGGKLRKRMADAAVRLARSVGYQNAGTLEFLLDEEGRFYFMEMNTRIQVEHPVTEMVTGIDLIKEQIKVAAGESLGFRQDDVVHTGHAIECRINAEHPETFVPSPGTITTFHVPGGPGVRIDTAAHPEARISPYYDSMIAKLITRGNNRMEAISRMRRSLEVMVVEGIHTNIPLHRRILNDADFIRGHLDTGFLERMLTRRDEAAAS
ncbi:MAG TPA: acetyl-CoA carboxylase biotin carboxylase subunit, partial [Verrucomicrobiae bacterium]|nr:acetyl-CoA carboxylase biotin carboxylase subunit [Verrucomicrobiae bacterium]